MNGGLSLALAQAQINLLSAALAAAQIERDQERARADAAEKELFSVQALLTTAQDNVESNILRHADERNALAAQCAKLREVLQQSGKSLEQYAAECFPEITNGQKHFVRVLMEGWAQEFAEAVALTPADCAKELAELHADKKRLDWLKMNTYIQSATTRKTVQRFEVPVANSLRQAIDAAIRSTEGSQAAH